MSAEAAAAILPSFGAVEVGTSLSMILLGIAMLQAWNYFRGFPDDPLYIKLMVSGVCIMEVVHAGFFMHAVYYWTITGPVHLLAGNPTTILLLPWSIPAALVVVGLIIATVQIYFCLRVYRITQSLAIALGCGFLALARFGLNISLAGQIAKTGTLSVIGLPLFKWQTVAELSTGTLSDICVAASLCSGLLRRRSGFAPTDKLVDKLVGFTIGTGLLTSISSVTELITFVTLPSSFVWVACFSIVSKLFSNSLLASLNQRRSRSQHDSYYSYPVSGATTTRVEFQRGQAHAEMELAQLETNSDVKIQPS